jgi:hypothetical protein
LSEHAGNNSISRVEFSSFSFAALLGMTKKPYAVSAPLFLENDEPCGEDGAERRARRFQQQIAKAGLQ